MGNPNIMMHHTRQILEWLGKLSGCFSTSNSEVVFDQVLALSVPDMTWGQGTRLYIREDGERTFLQLDEAVRAFRELVQAREIDTLLAICSPCIWRVTCYTANHPHGTRRG